MLRAARNVARLQARARKLRKDLKTVAVELRREKKNLRVLIDDRDERPNVFPSRLFGDGVGLVAKETEQLDSQNDERDSIVARTFLAPRRP